MGKLCFKKSLIQNMNTFLKLQPTLYLFYLKTQNFFHIFYYTKW